MFIRDMVDSPVQQNDEYTLRLMREDIYIPGEDTKPITCKNARHFTSLTNEAHNISNISTTDRLSKITHNTRYGHKTTKSMIDSCEGPIRGFRFASYRTEKERIQATINANQQFCDSVPTARRDRFERTLRPRRESKELGPQFRFTAKSGVERVYDQLSNRLTSAFQEKDIISAKLK